MPVINPPVGLRAGRVLVSRTAARPIAFGIPAAVWVVAALVVVLLLAVANAYGFHRDEMYFILAGRHPDWGYDDQPPITPLLAAASAQLLGASPFAIRILPALATAAVILLTASMAAELGASRRGQVLAAFVIAASMLVAAGHLMSTATFDILGWTALLWLLLPILSRPEDAPVPWRRWLAIGVVAGLALQNKNLPVFLAVALMAAFVLTRRWSLLRSPGLWVALGIAALIWLPNIMWQAAHGFPQLDMAGNIASDQSGIGSRVMFIVQSLLILGPLLFVVPLAGLTWLLRGRDAASWRPAGVAFVVIVALMLLVGGKSYYVAGFFPLLAAASGGPLERWLDRGRVRLRRVMFVAVSAVSCAIVVLVALPVIPVESLHSTPVPDLYPESYAQVGWPQLAAQTEAVVATLTPEERAGAVIVTPNYGGYGALAFYGHNLPPVYSAHVSVAYWGRPQDDAAPIILVAWEYDWTTYWFRGCHAAATIDNGYSLPTEEQGRQIFVCRGTNYPWSVIWPEMHHDN